MTLLSLSDEQIGHVMEAAKQLLPCDRDHFLRNVAAQLTASTPSNAGVLRAVDAAFREQMVA